MKDTAYSAEDEIFGEIHKMRTRIITAPIFDTVKVLGAILFEKTMDNEIAGPRVVGYLWETYGVMLFLKVIRVWLKRMMGFRSSNQYTGTG